MANNITGYNPDVLSCLANLSNDEVFTPPEVANAMLDMLPQELFADPDTKFLDPATKSGVFLREIAKRCLAAQFPGYEDALRIIDQKKMEGTALTEDDKAFQAQLQETIDHIFHEQLFGIAITELTSLLARRSLYCSKYPNSKYSVSLFDDTSGNIRFKNVKHRWQNGKCVFCGASEKEYARSGDLETHAYEFIHTTKAEDVFKMKFDVIIGNPPYQLSDGGNGASAKPLYHMFVEQAKKLNPRYLSFIIPARWYSGGKGLDEFRSRMLNDNHIRYLVDYTDSTELFPGVDIAGGICYFLWDRNNPGICNYTNNYNGHSVTIEKPLNEYSTFIRYPVADGIIAKVKKQNEATMDSMVTSRKPFGLATNALPMSYGDLTLRYNKGTGPYARSAITTGSEYIDKWKVMISYLSSEHAGQPDKNGQFKVLSTMEILPPKNICTETYLLTGWFDSEEEAKNQLGYLKTRFVRFLVGQIAVSQHITKGCFSFVPVQDFSKAWTDEELYEKYGLTQEEIDFIESMIKPME